MAAKQTPQRQAGGQQTGAGSGTSGNTVAHDLAAWRCWTWRIRHGCGCGRTADCLLTGPLPVHPAQPCRGEFTPAGWRPCCGRAAS
jgi:hypothetical protein